MTEGNDKQLELLKKEMSKFIISPYKHLKLFKVHEITLLPD